MNKKIVSQAFIATSIAMLYSSVGAADHAYPLTYEAAIRQALARHPEIAIEQVNLEGSAARVAEARGAFLPSLDALSNAERVRLYDDFSPVNINASLNNTNIPVTIKRTASPYQISTGIQLIYNLYSGGAHQARVNEAMAALQAAQAQDAITRKKIILDVTTAYWNLRKAEIACRKVRRAHDYARDEVAIATEQFNQGRLAKVELDEKTLAAEVQEIELRNAARSLQDFRRRYMFAVGLDNETQELPAPELHNQPSDVDLEKLLAGLGLMHKPEAVKALSDFQSAKAFANQISAEYKPVLDFVVRYDGVGRSQSNFRDAERHYGREVMTIGLRLKWNLFDGFRTDSRNKQAYSSLEKMRLRVDQVMREANNDWQERMSREDSMRDQLHLAEKQLELSQAQLKIAKKRLETHLISKVQYRLIQLAADDALSKVDTLRIDLLVARIERQLAAFE